MAAATQYYVFSVDTGAGIGYTVTTNPNFNGPGVKVGGPFATKAAAEAFITSGGASKGLSSTVLSQDQADVGDWIVVPEGEAGDIVNALSTALNSSLLADAIGEVKGDLSTGSATTYTVKQLTTATQVQNAETANLVLYKTKAEAQAAANTTNAANGPTTGTSWEQQLEELLSDLTSRTTWLRLAKIVTGVVLIAVSLVKLTGTDKAVATAAKGAIL